MDEQGERRTPGAEGAERKRFLGHCARCRAYTRVGEAMTVAEFTAAPQEELDARLCDDCAVDMRKAEEELTRLRLAAAQKGFKLGI
jgi:hypothetical protein